MPSPRYVPRSLTTDYHGFGLRKDVGWISTSNLDDRELDQLEAAKIQHLLAVAINAAIGERFSSRNAYAEAAGINSAKLGRMLRGEKPMTFEDLGSASRHLGISASLKV